MLQLTFEPLPSLGVVPVLVGPLQALMVMLPAILVAVAGAIVSMLKPRAIWAGIQLCWRLKVPLLSFILVVGAGIWGLSQVMPAGGAVAAEAAEGADWPLFRGNLLRTGAVPGTEGPNAGDVNWSHRAGAHEAYFASPAVVGNRIYISSANMNPFGLSGRIYCLDADTGAVVWDAAPRGYRPTFSSPSIQGDYLVVGEGLHDTDDARVVVMDLRPGHEGEIVWTYETESHVECTPVIANGRVYVNAATDGIYCFELEPDENGEPQLVWHIPGGEPYLDPETSLAVYGDTVILGLGIGGHAICLLDADTGEELHRFDTEMPVFGPPAVHDGVAYIAMGVADYVRSGEELRALILGRMREAGASEQEIAEARRIYEPRGAVWAVDIENREVLWRHELPRAVLGAVAVKDDEIYAGSRDGHLYVISTEGSRIGRWNAHSPIIASPAVTDRYVYAVTVDGSLYAVDRRRLEPVWERRIGSRSLAGSISSPAVAGGRLFVGTEDEGLLSVGHFSEEELVPLWPGHLGGPGASGNPEAWPLPAVGDFQTQYPADWMGGDERAFATAPPAILRDRLLVPVAEGDQPGLTVLSTILEGGALTEHGHYVTANPVHRSPAAADTRILLVDGAAGDDGRRLHSVELESLEAVWTRPVEPDATGTFIADHNAIFIQDRPGKLAAVDREGHTLWRKQVGRIEHSPVATRSMVVVATTEPKTLLVLDRKSGSVLWRRDLDHRPTAAPLLRRDRLWLGTEGGMLALSILDGRPPTDWPASGHEAAREAMSAAGVAGEVALTTRFMAWINDEGELIVLSTEDGELVHRAAGALPGTAPLISRQAIFYHAQEGVMRLLPHERDAAPRLWLDTSWLGEPTAGGMIADDGHLYLPLRGWGIVRAGSE